MYIDYKKKFCFIHNPRAGGTSMLAYLNSVFNLALQLGAHEILDRLYPRKLKNSAIVGNFFKCGFVRNPWDRLFSAYVYLSGGGMHFNDARVSNIFIDPFRGDFNAFVRSHETWFGAHCHFLPNSYKSSPHFQHQHKFFYYAGQLFPNFVGRFENYESELNNMLYVYACDYIDSPEKTRSFLDAVPNKIPRKNESSANQEDYLHAYDGVSIDIVSELYSTDIELFGYSFDG
jgi:hypothetical protein